MASVTRDSAAFMAKIIRTLLDKYPVSDEFIHCNSNAEFYDDSVKCIALRADLLALAASLREIVRYMDLAE